MEMNQGFLNQRLNSVKAVQSKRITIFVEGATNIVLPSIIPSCIIDYHCFIIFMTPSVSLFCLKYFCLYTIDGFCDIR